jgi:hypothetical protein
MRETVMSNPKGNLFPLWVDVQAALRQTACMSSLRFPSQRRSMRDPDGSRQ